MSNHSEEKKLRKIQQTLKNRRLQSINLQEEQLARGRDLEKEREKEINASVQKSSRAAAALSAKNAEPVWSARMQHIRDKNTGRHREAKERWNRFAGTESGGGRGL